MSFSCLILFIENLHFSLWFAKFFSFLKTTHCQHNLPEACNSLLCFPALEDVSLRYLIIIVVVIMF